jgi:hypothetical protein
MLRSFIKAARLRRWLARSDCPPAIKECKVLFDKAYAPKHNEYSGIAQSDEVFMDGSGSNRQQSVSVPSDLQPLIDGSKVILHAWCHLHGLVYAHSSTHLGNSLIHFYPGGNKSSPPIPGSIKYIFATQNTVAFAVQRHLNMQPGTIDPFAAYPDFPAKLYASALADELEVVELDWVTCHFARWQISSEHVVVLSLSKVSTKINSSPAQELIKQQY